MMVISIHRLLVKSAVITLLVCLWGLPVQADLNKDFTFKVSVDNTDIGTHSFMLRETGQQLTVHSKADFEFKLLFLKLFDYQHSSNEVWENGCLQRMNAVTNNNGETLLVNAVVVGSSLLVKTNSEKAELTGCIRSFAYWDQSLIQSEKLLNPQTGEYLKVLHRNLGAENFEVGGKQVTATRILISTKEGPINIWYDKQGEWLALESERSDGKVIRYQRLMQHESS